jgi:maleate cis-trans isomerase
MATVGLLYPGHSAEDDYAHAERILDAAAPGEPHRFPLTHTSVGEDAHRVDALLDLGSAERLAEGADRLVRDHSPDVVVWACTSGSFVFGYDGARRQVKQLREHTGRPATSTSLAFARAVRHLGLSRVAVAASYPRDVAVHFVDLLHRAGATVTDMTSHEIVTAAEVGTLDADQVARLVRKAPRRGAQALLVPDTAMHTLGLVPALEEAAGMPVLTANQVTVWDGLRLLDHVPHAPGLGRLFDHEASA